MIGLERWSNYYRDRIDFESGILQAENSLIFQKSIASFRQDIEQAQGIIKRRKNILKLSRSLYKFDHRPPPFSPSGIIDSPRFQLVQRVSVDRPFLSSSTSFCSSSSHPLEGHRKQCHLSSARDPRPVHRGEITGTDTAPHHTSAFTHVASPRTHPTYPPMATLSSKCREMVAPTNGYLLSGSEFF